MYLWIEMLQNVACLNTGKKPHLELRAAGF